MRKRLFRRYDAINWTSAWGNFTTSISILPELFDTSRKVATVDCRLLKASVSDVLPEVGLLSLDDVSLIQGSLKFPHHVAFGYLFYHKPVILQERPRLDRFQKDYNVRAFSLRWKAAAASLIIPVKAARVLIARLLILSEPEAFLILVVVIIFYNSFPEATSSVCGSRLSWLLIEILPGLLTLLMWWTSALA